MEEYGLTVEDIFARNEKGEGFLRDVIAQAHDAVGYQMHSENIAMQITPIRDEGLVITFSEAGPMTFRNILEHIREVLTGIQEDFGTQDENGAETEVTEEEPGPETEQERLFLFASMNDLLQYCSCLPPGLSVRSSLYKTPAGFFLRLEKGRLSWLNFNKISAQAIDFSTMVAATPEQRIAIEEHGECLLDGRAVSRLRKIEAAARTPRT